MKPLITSQFFVFLCSRRVALMWNPREPPLCPAAGVRSCDRFGTFLFALRHGNVDRLRPCSHHHTSLGQRLGLFERGPSCVDNTQPTPCVPIFRFSLSQHKSADANIVCALWDALRLEDISHFVSDLLAHRSGRTYPPTCPWQHSKENDLTLPPPSHMFRT